VEAAGFIASARKKEEKRVSFNYSSLLQFFIKIKEKILNHVKEQYV